MFQASLQLSRLSSSAVELQTPLNPPLDTFQRPLNPPLDTFQRLLSNHHTRGIIRMNINIRIHTSQPVRISFIVNITVMTTHKLRNSRLPCSRWSRQPDEFPVADRWLRYVVVRWNCRCVYWFTTFRKELQSIFIGMYQKFSPVTLFGVFGVIWLKMFFHACTDRPSRQSEG